MKFVKLLVNVFWFPAAVYFFNVILYRLGFYVLWPWIDTPMHFLGGVSIAYAAHVFFNFGKKEKWLLIKNKWVYVFLITSVVALIAVFWEVYEFLSDIFRFTRMQLGIADTTKDMIIGIFGGAMAGLVLISDRRKK